MALDFCLHSAINQYLQKTNSDIMDLPHRKPNEPVLTTCKGGLKVVKVQLFFI